MTNELTDLHCHILPGIDDGARTCADARALLEQSARGGVKRFVFTPHFYPQRMAVEDFLRGRAAAYDALRAELRDDEGFSALPARLGAEVAYMPFLERLPLEQLAFSGTGYFLLELDFYYLLPGVEDAIRAARERGLTPILAHVERYPYVEADPTLLYSWVRAGALAQVNASFALHGAQGRKRLLQYADWGLVHFMASDAHDVERRPARLAEGYAKLPDALAAQLQQNADAVFDGAAVAPPPPSRPVKRWNGWK